MNLTIELEGKDIHVYQNGNKVLVSVDGTPDVVIKLRKWVGKSTQVWAKKRLTFGSRHGMKVSREEPT